MAIVQSREVELVVGASIKGGDAVAKLSDQLAAASQHAGAAAEPIKKLAAEVAALEQRASLAGQFSTIRLEVGKLEAELGRASGRVGTLATQLQAAGQASSAAALAQSEAASKLAAARNHHDQLKDAVRASAAELKTLRAESRAAGGASEEHGRKIAETRARLTTLRDEARAAGATVRELNAAHRASAAEARAASQAESALGREYKATVADAAKLSGELGRKNQALAQTRKALQDAGISTRGLAAEQKRLAQAMAEAQARAAQLVGAQRAQAAAGTASAGAVRAQSAALKEAGASADLLGGKLKEVSAAVAGVFAVSRIPGLSADLARTADAYANIAARINVVNSTQQDFNLTLEETAELSRRTFSGLDSTTQLVTSLANAGDHVRLTQADVLRLTETINKANQLSGQSSAAADAAVVQLIQGLQSGVLRGQEFNSVMKQAPRLAKALADGIGVSVGALRQMAEQGELTADVVGKALLSQSQAIDEAFSLLPTTIGNAITNLSTNWTTFIGEMDKTSGASATVVKAIEAIGDNLDKIGQLASAAGQILLVTFSVKAVQAVQAFAAAQLAAATAAGTLTAASTAQAGAAAAAARSTGLLAGAGRAAALPMAALTVAIATSTAAVWNKVRALGALRVAMLSSGVGALALGLGALIAKFTEGKSEAEEFEAGLKHAVAAADFSSAEGIDSFIAQLRELGPEASAAGEQIEKALGARLRALGEEDLNALRDRLSAAFEVAGESAHELAAALAAVNARLADIEMRKNWARAIVTEAEAARFKLNELQQQFRDAGTEAAAVGEALKKAFGTADLGSLDGIVKLVADMDLLQQSAYATGEQIDTALRERLAQLTGNELREFGIMAEMAFNQGKLGAEALARINDQMLGASFAKLGVNAAQAMGTISAGAADAIATFDEVDRALQKTATSAAQVEVALEMAFSQGIARADSLQALEQFEDRLGEIASTGQLSVESMDRLNAAIEEQRAQIEDQIPGIQSLAEAYRNLGIKTQEELMRVADGARESFEFIKNSGKASAADIKAAFTEYAEAAIAATGGVANEALKAQAAQVGMKIEVDETGKTVVRTMAESKKATEELTEATKDAAGGMGTIGEAAEEAATGLAAAWDDAGNIVSTVAGGASDDIRRVSGATQEWTGSLRSGIQTGESWARLLEARMAAVEASANNVAAGLERLDRQQSAINSNGARGVEDLKFRLI
nr:tape measure protein [Zoogloeaceae bacterium]